MSYLYLYSYPAFLELRYLWPLVLPWLPEHGVFAMLICGQVFRHSSEFEIDPSTPNSRAMPTPLFQDPALFSAWEFLATSRMPEEKGLAYLTPHLYAFSPTQVMSGCSLRGCSAFALRWSPRGMFDASTLSRGCVTLGCYAGTSGEDRNLE